MGWLSVGRRRYNNGLTAVAVIRKGGRLRALEGVPYRGGV